MKLFEVKMVNSRAVITCVIIVFLIVFSVVIYFWDFISQNRLEYILAIILVPVIILPIVLFQKLFISKNEVVISETELKIRKGNTIRNIPMSEISSLKYYHEPGRDVIYILIDKDELRLILEGKNQASSFKGIVDEILLYGNYKKNVLMNVDGVKDIEYKKEG
jgi:hypothetical protein